MFKLLLENTTSSQWNCTEGTSLCASARKMAFHCLLLLSKLSKFLHSIVPTRNLRHLLHPQQKLNLYQPLHHLSGSCICADLLKLIPQLSTILILIHCDKLRGRQQGETQILPLSLLSSGNTANTFTQFQLAISSAIQLTTQVHPLKF